MDHAQIAAPDDGNSVATGEARAGKYLTFVLGDEEYGVGILSVKEIIGMMEVASVPQTPPFVKGVINLRGKVIPIIDLRLKFGMPEAEHTAETCVIVVEVQKVMMGVVVDTVREVVDIAEDAIENPPSFGESVEIDFILGMGKMQNRIAILLDINKVLQDGELVLMDAMQTTDDVSVSA